MATALGWVNIPFVPSFGGIAKQLADNFEGPATQSGRRAAKAVEKSAQEMVNSLDRQVKASQRKVGELEKEHKKSIETREIQQGKLNAAIAKQTAAEEEYQKALKDGKSGISQQAKLEAAKAKVTEENVKLKRSEEAIKDAQKQRDAQAKDLTDTQEKLAKAQKDAADEAQRSESMLGKLQGGLDDVMSKASEMGGPIGSTADLLSNFKLGPAAGVAAVGGAFAVAAGELGKFSSELEDSRVDMQNQFGLSADAARDMQGEIADAMGSGLGDYETTAMAVTSIAQVWGDEVSHMGGQTAAQLADDFMAFNDTFARSAEETASTVDVMLNSGMVDSAQEGLDLLTAGMQSVPAAMQDEVFDAMNEYSKNFANLGFTGSEAMAMLADASENGQYAIDKTGDALKELTVNAIDPARLETLADMGITVEDFGGRIATGGEEARSAMEEMAKELLAIEDPMLRGEAAVAAFGAPIEDLGIENIPTFLESLVEGSEGMGDFEGAAQTMADNTTQTFSGMVASWKGRIHGWAIDATLQLNEWGGEAADAIINSPIVGAIGDTFTEVKDLAGGVWDILWNGDYEGLPFGIEEDSAFVDFLFTTRENVIEFKDDVVDAWGEIKAAFTGGDDGFGALANLIGEENAEDLMNIIADIGERFTEFKDNVVETFETVQEFVQPIFDWLAEFFTDQMAETFASIGDAFGSIVDAFATIGGEVGGTLWETLQGVFEVFKALWDLLSPFLLPVLKIIGGIVGGVLVGAFMLAVGAIRLAAEVIEILANIISWVVENVISPLISAVGTVAHFFADVFAGALSAFGDYFSNVFGAVRSIWDGFTDLLYIGYEFITTTIFDGIGAGLGTLRDNFDKAVDAIAKIWDGIKEAAAAPVRFMIDTVWNNGIIRAIDAVASLIGMEGPDPIDIGFARGGILPGFSRMSDGDDQLVWARQGEGWMVSEALQDEASRRLFLDANEAGKRGTSFAEYMRDYVSAYASGGIVGSLNSIISEFYPMLQLTSHFRPGDSGYHGKNMAADFSNTGAGMPSTPEMQAAAAFMYGNYGDQLEQLIHHPARNIGSGRDVGDGFGYYGAGTMYEHTDHIHLAALQPLVDPSGVVQMVPFDGDEGGGAWWNPITWAKKAWDTVINAINPYPDEGDGWFSQIPGNFLSSAASTIWEWVTGKIGAGSYDGAGGISGQAESWREMAMAAMRRNGFDADDPAQVNAMIAQIQSESGGIPDRNQEIVDMNGTGASAGQGLLQIIPTTFADHRDPSLPDDRTDPWANMNAALRYYKSRYGNDLTTMWGHGHGYALGGIVGAPEIFTRDLGGWVPDGAIVRNTSGRDELMLPPEVSEAMASFFKDYPEAAEVFLQAAENIEEAAEFLAEAATYDSEEGVTARESIRRVLGLGLDLPGSDVVLSVLDGERAIWDARYQHIGHLETIAEKTKALEDAQKALIELESSESELSKEDQRKLDDAKAKVEEAKADEAKADSDEKRAKAADKVADAEEKLLRVREDLDDKAEESAKKRVEDIEKANEDVAKAEQELADARAEQVADLDHITLISQGTIEGLIPMAEGLASQLISMGAASGAVNAGLGQVVGALGSAASMAGPAGITLGMAFTAVQVGIEIIQQVVGLVNEIIENIFEARQAARQALADAWAVITDYVSLNMEMQQEVSSLQQELVRGLNDQRAAAFALQVATNDRLIAEREGALSVAEARQALDDEIEEGALTAQLRLMGLHEDWDSYMSFQALVGEGVLEKWSDSAISALFTYEAARAQALQGELTARVEQIQAEAALAEATRNNLRNQEDLLAAQERLIRMAGEVAGVDLVEATATSQVANLMVEMAEVQKKMDSNLAGRIGAFIGTRGPWSNEFRGQEAHLASLRTALDAVLEETGVELSDRQIQKAIEQMSWVAATEGDPMAVLRQHMPELVAAETALKVEETLKPVDEARESIRDAEREAEDFRAEIDLYEKVTPLEETIAGLGYTIQSLEAAAEAWAEGNESLRGEYVSVSEANAEAAKELGINWKFDEQYFTANLRSQIQQEVKRVTINLDGEKMYTADQVDALLKEVTDGSNITVETKKTATNVAESRRKERV